MNCVYNQPVFICTDDRNGDSGRTRSIWLYFEGLLLQAGVNGKEESGALLRAL